MKEEDLFAYACKLLGRQAYTRLGIARKLADKGDAPTIETVLKKLSESGYLDDRTFAQNYVQILLARHPCGRRLLESKLRSKEVSVEIIKDVLNQLDAEAEETAAKNLAAKKASLLKNIEPEIRKRRLYQFLLNRGFSPDIAKKYAEEF